MSNQIEGKVLGFRNWTFHEGHLHPLNYTVPVTRISSREFDRLQFYNVFPNTVGVSEDALRNAQWDPHTDQYILPPQPDPKGMGAWVFGENEAVCRHRNHASPQKDCECGLYAWHRIGKIRGNMVAGAILGWGKTIVHRDGFRCASAQIVALSYCDEMKYGDVKALKKLATDNGIIVCEFEQLENVGSEFGEPVAEELRPEIKQSPRPDYNAIISHYHGQYLNLLKYEERSRQRKSWIRWFS